MSIYEYVMDGNNKNYRIHLIVLSILILIKIIMK